MKKTMSSMLVLVLAASATFSPASSFAVTGTQSQVSQQTAEKLATLQMRLDEVQESLDHAQTISEVRGAGLALATTVLIYFAGRAAVKFIATRNPEVLAKEGVPVLAIMGGLGTYLWMNPERSAKTSEERALAIEKQKLQNEIDRINGMLNQ